MPNQKNLEVVIHGEGAPTHAIIWLHGLGASSSDFPPIIPHLKLNNSPSIRFVFPQAPSRPITINNGLVMPGWYDIKGSDIADKEDLQGMQDSHLILSTLIDQQIEQGISSENIIIAGFSQGGAVAYYTGLRSHLKLGGILALSTYLSFKKETRNEQSNINLDTPILVMHGVQDPVVPYSLGKESAGFLAEMGYNIQLKTYPMQHEVVMEQIEDIGSWINSVFSDSN